MKKVSSQKKHSEKKIGGYNYRFYAKHLKKSIFRKIKKNSDGVWVKSNR